MNSIAQYATYEEANERQLDLLASGIDAKVEFVPSGNTFLGGPVGGFYHLCTWGEDATKAVEIISPKIDHTAKSIASCPKCGSSRVQSHTTPAIVDLGLFMIPSMIEFVRSKSAGELYVCETCKNKYRRKLAAQ